MKLITKTPDMTRAAEQFNGQSSGQSSVPTAQQPTANAQSVLRLEVDQDPRTLDLQGVARVELQFPKFSDGRAFSQAYLLRRRLDFAGEIRAVGDVLVDQLVQMKRSGFDAAELREDQNLLDAVRQMEHFKAFYQGDAVNHAPLFAREPSAQALTQKVSA